MSNNCFAGERLMPILRNLRTAKAQLELDVPDSYLRAVVGLEAGSSDYRIRQSCKEYDLELSAGMVRNLQAIIELANQLEFSDQEALSAPGEEVQFPEQDNLGESQPSELSSVGFALPADEELTLEAINPVTRQVAVSHGGAGTDGDFSGFYDIDLPDTDIDDIQLHVENGVIHLEWKGKGNGYSYVLVGSQNDFPADVRHGGYRWLTKETKASVPFENSRFFTVFAFREKGTKGKQVAQGLLVDDIIELEAEAYENEIRLRWVKKTQDGIVKVARSAPNQQLPKPLTFSNYLPVPSNALAFTDINVNPGDTYEYRVFVEWKGPGGQIFETPGARIVETTPSRVPQVENFSVSKSVGDTVEISYSPLNRGEIRVYQLRGLPSAELTAAKVSRAEFDLALLDAGEYKWLGTRIIGSPESISSKVVINAPMLPGQKDSRTYVAISVLGSKALISDVKVVQQVGDIQELKVIDRYDYVLLRVSPPAGANALDVWVLSENSEIGTASPTRRVQIDDEYRRFGGVIFADEIKGLDKARALDREAKKIIVRGVSSWDGEDHLGTPNSVVYPGRLEIHYRAIRLGALTQKGYLPWYAYIFPWLRKRYLKKASEQLNTTDLAKFEVKIVGNSKTRQNSLIKANHFVGTSFPIDKDDQVVKEVKQFQMTFEDEQSGWLMENKIGEFEVDITRTDAEKMVGNSTQAKSERAKRRSRDSRGRFKSESEKFTLYPGTNFHRMVPIVDPAVNETIFSIDETQYPVQANPAVDTDLKVVIMGPKRSGKTTYVQALVNYLSNQLSVQMRSRLIAEDSDEYTIKKLQEMESFISLGNLPQATQSASPFASGSGPASLNDPRKPMKFLFENGESVPIRRLHLTDVAGEDMDKLETMRLYSDSLAEADLIVFLVDPLQIKQVRVALAGKPLPQEGGADPFNVLLNLATLMKEIEQSVKPNQKFAVVISKFDGIEDLSTSSDNPMSGTITPGMAVTRDPMTNSKATSTALADLQDNIRVNNEAIAVLERLRAGDFLTLVKNKLPMAQYFVVSALGHASYNDKMDSAGISSFRISDPIRWAAATMIQEQISNTSVQTSNTAETEPAEWTDARSSSVVAPSPTKENMILSQESAEYEQAEDVEVEIPVQELETEANQEVEADDVLDEETFTEESENDSTENQVEDEIEEDLNVEVELSEELETATELSEVDLVEVPLELENQSAVADVASSSDSATVKKPRASRRKKPVDQDEV
jgi:hypothetical protein